MPHLAARDGVTLHYEDEGEGQPLVLVHGWMMSGRVWAVQQKEFRASNRVIVPDLRGCGASGARQGTHNIPHYAEDLHELLSHLDVAHALLVGWSMGGGIVMEYLRGHGTNRVAGVGLVDFPPRLEEEPSVADKVCHGLRTRRDSFTRQFIRRMFLGPPSPDLEDRIAAESARCAPEVACEMYRAMRQTAASANPEPYSVPALLAFPSAGWFPQALDAWRRVFPNHLAPAFPDSKHCPFLEEPEAFNAALRRLAAGAARG